MRLLLDTHVFLWWELRPERLSAKVRALCESGDNDVVLSVASVWEMQIKLQLGKLRLQRSLEEVVRRQERQNNVRILSVELPHVLELQNLPSLHKDPFDRLLISQAKVEGLSLVSTDKALRGYSIEIVW